MILHSTFEYYLLEPRGYHTFALHRMNFDGTILFPVVTTLRVWVVVNREHRVLLLHHSVFLMSPLFDCIFLKPFDMMFRGHHRHFDFSQVLLGCIVRNTILAPRRFALSSTTSFDSRPIQTWSCIPCSAFPWERYTPDTCVSSHFPFHWSV